MPAPARLRYEDKDLKTRGNAFPLKFQSDETNRHRVRANRHRVRAGAQAHHGLRRRRRRRARAMGGQARRAGGAAPAFARARL